MQNIKLVLIDENGKLLKDSELNIVSIVKDGKLSENGQLKFIDPYGNTIFNQLQSKSLIDEVKGLLHSDQKPLIKKIISFMLSNTEPHTYFAFIGD